VAVVVAVALNVVIYASVQCKTLFVHFNFNLSVGDGWVYYRARRITKSWGSYLINNWQKMEKKYANSKEVDLFAIDKYSIMEEGEMKFQDLEKISRERQTILNRIEDE
jgi:hypothetical protein